MKGYSISVVIPAHNEEKFVSRCIHSVKRAAAFYGGRVEIIVVCNRCTDRTAELAEKSGAKVLYNDERCIASVRNTGIFAAEGDIVVTIDCDNRMTKGTLREIAYLMATGLFIGGGAPIRFDRNSFPLFFNDVLCKAGFRLTGLYCGIFWAFKKTFIEIGGFTEAKAMEDISTARKLKHLGEKQGKKYTVLRDNYLINSTRKFDDLGDWLYFKLLFENTGTLLRAAFGDKTKLYQLLDRMFYDYNYNAGAKGGKNDADN